jgi:predicted amidohydrolase
MKICVAQTESITGDLPANIARQTRFIELAASNGSNVIIFPELSLTGYEPSLANDLAIDLHNGILTGLQQLSDRMNITIGAGMPVKREGGIGIGMIVFQPVQQRRIYFKKFLHPDEDAFFVSGENLKDLKVNNTTIAFAICYEISIPAHTQDAFQHGANIYIASVAKSVNGIDKATEQLSKTAKRYNSLVMMSNCIGQCDGMQCAGKSSVWNNEGKLIDQLDDSHEGLLIVDTTSLQVEKKVI